MSALTRQQATLLSFIKSFTEANKHAPSFEEMKNALGLKSKSGIHRLINALHERGYIRRLPDRARAIQVIEDPHLIGGKPSLSSFTNAELLRELNRRFSVPSHAYAEDFANIPLGVTVA